MSDIYDIQTWIEKHYHKELRRRIPCSVCKGTGILVDPVVKEIEIRCGACDVLLGVDTSAYLLILLMFRAYIQDGLAPPKKEV